MLNLKITTSEVRDSLELLAKTAKLSVAPAVESPAPALEYHLDAESSYVTPSTVRPDDTVIEVKMGTDGNTADRVFRGLVDYVDDFTEANGYTGEIDMSELSPGRAHKRRVTGVYNDSAALNYSGGAILHGGFGQGSLTGHLNNSGGTTFRGVEYVGIANSSTLGGVGGGSFTAKKIIHDVCRKVGLIVGSLDFPDYKINGTFVIEDQTAPEVAKSLVDPFNLFPYLQYTVRIYGNVLGIIGSDYTRTGNADAFICENITSIKRSWQAYEADHQVGPCDIILTGGVRPSAIELAYKTVMRDIPLDDPEHSSTDFEAQPTMQELYIQDVVTTVNSQDSKLPNPNGGYRPTTDRKTETVSEIGSYVLLNGFDSDLVFKAEEATGIYTNLVTYANMFAGLDARGRIDYMRGFYPLEDDEQLAQRANEREGQIVGMRNKFKTISEGLNKILSTAMPPDISGEGVSGSGLSTIPPDALTIVYTYDSGGAVTGASLEPAVVYGNVSFLNSMSVLGTRVNKSTTTESESLNGGALKRETVILNTYDIVDVGFERKLLVQQSEKTVSDYSNDGSILEAKEQVITKYFYDKYGDLFQKVDEVNTIVRGALIRVDTNVDITPKNNVEYAVRDFEDGQRGVAVGQKYFELGVAANDIMQSMNQRGSSTFSGSGPIPYYSKQLWRTSVDVGETVKRNKIRYCMLVNGVPMTDETFYRTAPVAAILQNVQGELDRALTAEEALARAQSGIRDTSPDEPPTFTPLGFKKSFPLFDFQGLSLVQSIIIGQRDLERLGAYWEESNVEMTLDTTPVVGGYAIAKGASGRIVDVRHRCDENSAITTLRLRKLVSQGQVTQR